MTEAVLDASAILALVYAEPGAQLVREAARNSVMSSVNFAETLSRVVDEGVRIDEIVDMLARIGVTVASADRLDAIAVGGLFEATRRTGVSLGDRFFLALVRSSGLPGLTADRRLAELDLGLDIRLIR
ncbi:MAG TPA: type II toxin-antitoxin system VapC family toxin [Caulobacteraceae bacterium]|nr:type II toxin-antitoxin system VapC family toxin [Caulobacteraceae bacterium]